MAELIFLSIYLFGINILWPLFLINLINCSKSFEYKRTDELESAMNGYEQYIGTKNGLSSNIGLGMWYHFSGNFAVADKILRHDLELLVKYGIDDIVGTRPIDYFLLGLSSAAMENFEESFDYLNKAEKEFKRIGHIRGIARCYYSRALNYKVQGKYDAVLEELDKGLKIVEHDYKIEKHIKTKYLIEDIRKEIGNILKITGKEFKGKNCYDWWTENFQEGER